MSFLYPSWLWLLIPLILYGYLRAPRRLKSITHILIAALILIALSRPRIAHTLQPATLEARDILIALDLSYSMRAQDIPPSRYAFARRTIEALLDADTQDNIMLIAFTTNPLILAPPTTDHALVATALRALDPENILTKGTSLERLFALIGTLPPLHREVILITDGGEERDLTRLLKYLDKNDMTLHILAMGTKEGTTIPLPGGKALKDAQQHLVISRLNPLLEQVASQTGGSYTLPQSTPEATAQTLLSHIAEGERSTITKTQRGYTELYQVPLLFAVVLLLALYTRASRYLLLLFALAHIPLEASMLEEWQLAHAYDLYAQGDYNQSLALLKRIETPSLQQRYALASACYRMGAYERALALYRTIRTTSPVLKQKLYYNIANTYAQLHTYDKAKVYYTKALQLGEDADALHNLKVVTFAAAQKKQAGRTLPRSEGAQSKGASEEMTASKKEEGDSQNSGAGSGGGGEKRAKASAKEEKRLLLPDKKNETKQPLGSKVYELINKGYIREKQPW